MNNLRIETKENFKTTLGFPITEFPVQNKNLNIFIDKEHIDYSSIDLLEVNLNPGRNLATGNIHLTNLEPAEFKPVVECPEWIPVKKVEYPYETVPEGLDLNFKLQGIPTEDENLTACGFDIDINLGNKVVKPSKAKLVIERNKIPYVELRIPLSDLSINLNADFNIITEE